MEKVKDSVNIIFKHLEKIFKIKAVKGISLLEAAHANNIPLEGACDGNLACSTCHVICEEGVFDHSEISDRENDLLDLAYGLKPTSRLACQIKIDKKLEDRVFEIPKCTRNLAVDGYKPPLH